VSLARAEKTENPQNKLLEAHCGEDDRTSAACHTPGKSKRRRGKTAKSESMRITKQSAQTVGPQVSQPSSHHKTAGGDSPDAVPAELVKVELLFCFPQANDLFGFFTCRGSAFTRLCSPAFLSPSLCLSVSF
jgi:hypothetical protein